MENPKNSQFEPVPCPGVEIRLADGSTPSTWHSVRSWEPEQSHAREPITADELMEEKHHHYYGRPWVLGRYYTNELLKFGLNHDEEVLDVGCGAGRVGIHLIPYLESGCYCGIDYHLRSLVAFATYEAFLYNLGQKRPRLLWDSQFRVTAFKKTFDVVLDFYVTHHLDLQLVRTAYKNIAEVTHPGSRVFLAHVPTIGINGMKEAGFSLQDTQEVSYPLIIASTKPLQKTDVWHLFVRT